MHTHKYLKISHITISYHCLFTFLPMWLQICPLFTRSTVAWYEQKWLSSNTPWWGYNMEMLYTLLSQSPWGRFKNTYELLNLRALKCSPVNKIHIFQCMGKIFCVEFQRYPLKFHTKYLTHTLKDIFLYNNEILRALRFKSSYAFLKCPPVHSTQRRLVLCFYVESVLYVEHTIDLLVIWDVTMLMHITVRIFLFFNKVII